MAQVTWLGDEDPSVQQIEQFGHTFVKGVPTDVPNSEDAKFSDNAFFAVGEKGEPIDSIEPAPLNPEEGSEIAAVKKDLDELGVSYKANATLPVLRKLLADKLEG